MKCWKCGKEITEADVCLYCGAIQERTEPKSDYGKALRKIYDDYGIEDVFGDSRCITSSLNDLVPESEAFTHSVEYVYHMGLGKLYESQLHNVGKPDENFYKRVKSLITKEAGFSESKADEIIAYFDEMIGWDSSVGPDAIPLSSVQEEELNSSVFATTPSKPVPEEKPTVVSEAPKTAAPAAPVANKKKSIKPFIFVGAGLLAVILLISAIFAVSAKKKKTNVDQVDQKVNRSSDIESKSDTESSQTTKIPRPTDLQENSRTFSENIINFDEMNFYIKGKKYTLGKNTLQDMIDDGVDFDWEHSDDLTKNITWNDGVQSADAMLGDKWYVFIGVRNFTDTPKHVNQCPVFAIVLRDIDKNYENKNNFALDFPYNITMAELLANAGAPEGYDWYQWDSSDGTGRYSDKLKYNSKTSYKFSHSYYEFEYEKGEITAITLRYMPPEDSGETETTQESTLKYSGKIVDFEDMHFYLNGKKYTLDLVLLILPDEDFFI